LSAIVEPSGRRGWSVSVAAGLFTVATLTFTSAFAAFLRMQGSSDLTVHIAYAKDLHSLADLKSPHFLFQLLVNAAHRLGLSHETAAIWLLGGCYGAMAVLIAREMHQRGVGLSPFPTFLVVMALLLASHIFLATLRASHIYSGYFVPTAYHNPTQQVNKLFALSIWFVYARQLLGTQPARWSIVPLLAALCVASAVAKPSFLIAFLPVAALYAAGHLMQRRWRQALACLAGIGVPSALVLLWQMRISQGVGEPVQIALVPFALFPANETLYKLPASLAFPLIVAAGALWTRRSDVRLRFIWALMAVALFVMICVVEAGQRMNHGNFAWTGQTGVFLVYVESMLFLLAQPARAWVRTAWGAFAVHVACGLVWYGIVFRDDWGNWL
jgi:hypothetical protein